ncbi:MAG: NTP transferase domain-containing protein [Gammaproteobacteria bacterium]|nr:NTP transferase domain-containing protein [Gammaproteobacteria bacterium]
MSLIKHVVIAAAGLGSRLGMSKPKCLVEVHGKPIIAYLLELLIDIEDVRVVTGFCEDQVMDVIKKIRPDIIFVRNANFYSTKTIDSYALGARGIENQVLFLDADIIFSPQSFKNFLHQCVHNKYLIGITDTKTEDAVFAQVNEENNVISFSLETQSAFEWANILCAPGNYFEGKSGDVYLQLEKNLPLKACHINSFEVDRLSDLEKAISFAKTLTNKAPIK